MYFSWSNHKLSGLLESEQKAPYILECDGKIRENIDGTKKWNANGDRVLDGIRAYLKACSPIVKKDR